jgi:hypothetical protein
LSTWRVEVNEVAVQATQMGAEWWLLYRQVHQRTGRITVLSSGFLGEQVSVACEDETHARQLVDHMTEQGGLPKSAVKARRVAGAVA